MCNRNDAIFTMIDRFSKYVQFVLCMTTLDATATDCLFFDSCICWFGMPSKKISDWDPIFTSLL